MLNDIQITSDYMSRWVVLKRRVGAVTSQRVLKVLFYVNILQCFFVVENFTANAVSVAIGDNGNRLIFEIWWNFFYDLFSIKNVADVNSIDSFVSKHNIPFSATDELGQIRSLSGLQISKIKLAPLIHYTTLVYTSTLKSTV